MYSFHQAFAGKPRLGHYSFAALFPYQVLFNVWYAQRGKTLPLFYLYQVYTFRFYGSLLIFSFVRKNIL
ncbi:hypothetical protein AWR27_02150 [Spirosoma montaniterrae]|uniref:Uncharacterized protein n=1 Tax=Spirosoma montaniterrae TaxID=1178516 RepID=A0A1P9WS93_9BACT|nr:hypothetical protein AWR27_02150 [Spirosoma montaniterrae]